MKSGLVMAGILIGGVGFLLPSSLSPYVPYTIGLGLLLLLAGIFMKPKQKFA